MNPSQTRNFCIIAHVDHGKSTLADRILEHTGAVTAREARAQILDDMDLERERGITIKAKAVSLDYEVRGETWKLNLIDTPGHVDFSYEVFRSLAACEGAVLLVDAAQGVQAQSVSNAWLATEAGLEIIPVLNKCDLPGARPDEVAQEMETALGLEATGMLQVSAKTGAGIEAVIDRVINTIPPPSGDPDGPTRALIFDATYDDYRGVVIFVRVHDGTIRTGDRIRMLGTKTVCEVEQIGQFRPRPMSLKELRTGDVGYFTAGIKTLHEVVVGDTVTLDKTPDVDPLPGYKQPVPMVFCGLYPTRNADYPALRKALDRLSLNDSSLLFEPETSDALGFGFRCGFLGLLHMEIIQERLEREFDLSLVQTAPTVSYEIKVSSGETFRIRTPSELPEDGNVEEIREPVVRGSIVLPADCIGAVMTLNEEKRGKYIKTEYIGPTRVILTYDLPLAEVIFDYYDRLKSVTRGYATFDYELVGFIAADLVKLSILVGGSQVDAMSAIVHREEAYRRGRELLVRLRKEIPRHLFEVALQAAIGGRIIARESIKALRKNVTAKCYGGDITRKRKLLEKQKAGKRRMKQIGNVEIPQDAFMAMLSRSTDERSSKRGK